MGGEILEEFLKSFFGWKKVRGKFKKIEDFLEKFLRKILEIWDAREKKL